MVKLDDGRVWKRHLEQIHRIGEDIPEPPAEFSNFTYSHPNVI